jgi:hypothetical protein
LMPTRHQAIEFGHLICKAYKAIHCCLEANII